MLGKREVGQEKKRGVLGKGMLSTEDRWGRVTWAREAGEMVGPWPSSKPFTYLVFYVLYTVTLRYSH